MRFKLKFSVFQVTQFFLRHPQGPLVLEKRTSIKPMTTAMFIDLVNILLQVFDETAMVDQSDYITRLPTFTKRFGYRGKVEKSWLQTGTGLFFVAFFI